MLRLQIAARQNRVRGVLQQLANEDLRTAVGMLRQQIDDPGEIDLEFVFHD